jgi:hypothetical protein
MNKQKSKHVRVRQREATDSTTSCQHRQYAMKASRISCLYLSFLLSELSLRLLMCI